MNKKQAPEAVILAQGLVRGLMAAGRLLAKDLSVRAEEVARLREEADRFFRLLERGK